MGLYGDAGMSDETAEYISKTLNVSKRDVMEMEQRLSGDSSLNAPLSHDSGTNFQEMLSDGEETIEQKIGDSQEMDLKKLHNLHLHLLHICMVYLLLISY